MKRGVEHPKLPFEQGQEGDLSDSKSIMKEGQEMTNIEQRFPKSAVFSLLEEYEKDQKSVQEGKEGELTIRSYNERTGEYIFAVWEDIPGLGLTKAIIVDEYQQWYLDGLIKEKYPERGHKMDAKDTSRFSLYRSQGPNKEDDVLSSEIIEESPKQEPAELTAEQEEEWDRKDKIGYTGPGW